MSEEEFPCLGKCCRRYDAAYITSYVKICPHCGISASLPYGDSLKIVTIYECGRLGYGKRVTE